MPTHDIIDNREEVLLEHVKSLLSDSVSAKFAVGYFFTSGLAPIIEEVQNLNELKILIGNVSNKRTIEQLAEAHMNLVTAKQEFNKQLFTNPSNRKHAVSETKNGIRTSLSLIDQTDGNEQMIRVLRELLEQHKIKIKIYTLGRLHSKAYIFDYPEDHHDKGNVIIGSSNLSLGGLSDNTELNALIPGIGNHEKITAWFNELWDKSEEFRVELMDELKDSWALNEVRPYDVHIKTLYHLLKDRLEIESAEELLWEATMPPLTTFQIVAVKQALQILNDYGGVFVADVVGTGKTYIGTAILKHLQMVHGDRPLIICPKSLEDTWKDFCSEYGIQSEILTMGMISQGTIDLITDILTAINKIKCGKDENPLRLPVGFNKSVTKVMKQFRRDVGERMTKRDAMRTLKPQQRYVLNKLQRYYEEIDNPETKSDIERLKEVFGLPLSNIILQHLGKLRRGGIDGKELFDRSKEIYFQYGLHRVKEEVAKESSYDIPRIICSMSMQKRAG